MSATEAHATRTQIRTPATEQEKSVFHAPVGTEMLMRICLVKRRTHGIEILEMRRMTSLPEQSSYRTCRPRRGSVFPGRGWTWRSMVSSCWWSGRYTGLWRKEQRKSELHKNPQRLLKRGRLRFRDTDENFWYCIVNCPYKRQQLSHNTEMLCFSFVQQRWIPTGMIPAALLELRDIRNEHHSKKPFRSE